MPDSIFIQFYDQVRKSYVDLGNGFSDAHDLCRRKGDFYWVNLQSKKQNWEDQDKYYEKKLPIKKGTAYVSAVYINQLYQTLVWANAYPDIEFIIGGPAVAQQQTGPNQFSPVYFKVDDQKSLPANLTLTGKSVEEWFKIPDFSLTWKLDALDFIPPDIPLYFSYTLDNDCYWRKCTYCNIGLHACCFFRKRKKIDLEFKQVNHAGKKIIRLNTPSIRPEIMKKTLSILPSDDDLEYRVFMRPGKPEFNALKTVLDQYDRPLPQVMFGLGVEFPVNRVLETIQKGFTQQNVLDVLKLTRKYGFKTNLNMILGWDFLIEQDLDELKSFMTAIPENSVSSIQLRWLFAHPYTRIHDKQKGDPVMFGPFYLGFNTLVDQTQMELNMIAKSIIMDCGKAKNIRIQGADNISRSFQMTNQVKISN